MTTPPIFDMSKAQPVGGFRFDMSKAKPIGGDPSRPAGLPAGVDLPQLAVHPSVDMQGGEEGLYAAAKQNFNAGTQHVPTKPIGQGFTASLLQNFGAGGGDAVRFAHRAVTNLPSVIPSVLPTPQPTLEDLNNSSTGDPNKDLDNIFGDVPSKLASAAGSAGTGLILGEIGGKTLAIPSAAVSGAKNLITGDLDAPILGTSTTPRARYDAAKRVGVNLDLADATNATIPKALKAVNQDSLAGSGVYEKNKVGNVKALNDYTDNALNAMSPLDRETGGTRLQSLFQKNQQALKNAADQGYGEIDAKYGDTPVRNPATLSDTASRIQAAQAQHLSEFPSLRPSKVGAVLDDASRFGKSPVQTPVASGLVDEFGKPLMSTQQPPAPKLPVIGDALKARSGILDMYQNNPDLVKSASDAQLQQLVGATHDTIMDSLPPRAQNTLRNAQTTYKEMKNVYDNPSSPLYDVVRTPNPSSKVGGIGPPTPESVRGLMGRVGDEGTGIMQRGVAEKTLGTAPGQDSYNFNQFPRQLSKLPNDYARELFGPQPLDTPRSVMTPFGPKLEYNTPDHLSALRDISDTSQAISKDLNPSGTAKQGQKLAEAAALIPTGGLPLLQYPAARLINSPSVVDYFMRGNAPRTTGKLLPYPASLATASAFRRASNE